jgi:hypothetical protein
VLLVKHCYICKASRVTVPHAEIRITSWVGGVLTTTGKHNAGNGGPTSAKVLDMYVGNRDSALY